MSSSSSITSTDFNHNREFHRRNYGQLSLPMQFRVANNARTIAKDTSKLINKAVAAPRSIKRDVVNSIDKSLGLSDNFSKAVHVAAPIVSSFLPSMSPHEVSTLLSYLPGGPKHDPPPARDAKRRKKNLTKEGVEPNPGPPKKNVLNKISREIVAASGKSHAQKETRAEFQTHMRNIRNGIWRDGIPPRVGAPGDTGVSSHEWNGKSFTKVFDPIGNMSEIFVNHSQARMTSPKIIEKLMDPYGRLVNATTSFNTQSFIYINPGNMFLHPVLSKLACLFQKYRYKHLRLMFRTEAYAASGSNTSSGKVMFVVNSDPTDQGFSDSASLQTYPGSVSGPPFTCYSIDLLKYLKNKDMPLKDYYVNYGANNSTSNNYSNNGGVFLSGAAAASTGILDPRFINEGWLQIAIEGAQSGELGDIFIESQMELIEMRAVLYTPPTLCSKFSMQFSAGAFNGTNNTLMNMSNFTVSTVGGTSNIFFNAVGFYKITMIQIGNAAATAPSVSGGSNITILYDVEGTTNLLSIQGINAASGNFAVGVYNIFVAAVPSINATTNKFSLVHGLGGGAGNATYDINQTCGAMGNALTGSSTIVAPGPNVISNRIQILEEKIKNDEERYNALFKMIETQPKIDQFSLGPIQRIGFSPPEVKIPDSDSESDYTEVESDKYLPSEVSQEALRTLRRITENNTAYAAKVKASVDYLKSQNKIHDSK
jgi:hypothetical protein